MHPSGAPRTPPDPPGHPLGVPRTPPVGGRPPRSQSVPARPAPPRTGWPGRRPRARRSSAPHGPGPTPCRPPSASGPRRPARRTARRRGDRKSTRLNSSHVEISYAVFCLKKKKKKKTANENEKKKKKKIITRIKQKQN